MPIHKYTAALVLVFFLFLLSSSFSTREYVCENTPYEPETTKDLIQFWKRYYANESLKEFTFTQETIQYKANGDRDTSIWSEALQYPLNFRIDFGNKSNQNTNLYRNDSLYVIRKGKLTHKEKHLQDFMIMSGAFYSIPIDTTLSKLQSIGINTEKLSLLIKEQKRIYVIGGDGKDFTQPQIWIDAESRKVVRQYLKDKKTGKITEVIFDRFVQVEDYLVESWLEFYRDGKLIQTERYFNINVTPNLPAKAFNPNQALGYYWY